MRILLLTNELNEIYVSDSTYNTYVTSTNNTDDAIFLNFELHNNQPILIKFNSENDLITHILKQLRTFFETTIGTDTDLAGYCIQTSEYIKTVLTLLNFKNVRTKEGWCRYDLDDYGSDCPWDPHTWCEYEDYYLDITADQFNYGMYCENEFPPVIFQKGLPHGMQYTCPDSF